MTMGKTQEYAGVSRTTLQQWMRDGLKHCRLNNKTVRIHTDDVDAFIRQFEIGVDIAEQVDGILKKIRRAR